MVELLGGRSWLERPSDLPAIRHYSHSRTRYHAQWNCDIDVYCRFPGMEASPDIAFGALWHDRHYLVMAARGVPVPSIPAAVIFPALHSFRAMDDLRHQREYSGLLQRVATSMHQEIVDLSAELHATPALNPLLDDPGRADLLIRPVAVSEEWRYRTTVQGPGTACLVALLESPCRSKPRVLARAVFPPGRAYGTTTSTLTTPLPGCCRPTLRAGAADWPAFRQQHGRSGHRASSNALA
ncbi:hypothetical protein ACVWZ8_002371 [Arthrobacter sp. UYCu723]